ncbi:MAG: heparinase II/III family protein [Pseudomonadota bacterium]
MRVRPKTFLIIFIVLFWALIGYPATVPAQSSEKAVPWDRLRSDHPRLFFNRDLLRAAGAQAEGQARNYFESVLKWAEPAFYSDPDTGDHGEDAAAFAMIYLMTHRPEALRAAKRYLERSLAYYRQCDRAGKAVHWFSTSRINAICAYDWLYNDLSAEERKTLGRDILDHAVAVQPVNNRAPMKGGNSSGYKTGFYGEQSLTWYAGLATFGAGIDDALAKRLVTEGYESYMAVLNYRKKLAGDDGGGLGTETLSYAVTYHVSAEFNFFHTMKSAFGLNLAPAWPYVAELPHYIAWHRLSGNRHFAPGDEFHLTNKLPDWQTYTHLAQIRHFYGRSQPDQAALAAWLQTVLDKPEYVRVWPAIPLLLTGLDAGPSAKSPADLNFPPARHFENYGEIMMRSGMGDDDAYALFIAGSIIGNHKHFDENNFLLFYKGFLVLDSGSRPEPGSHLYNYYCRTVAHNCLLIRMPGEKMPDYWGRQPEYAPGEPPLSTPNDGGQAKTTGAKVLAFETNRDYTYLASDAAPAYHPGKCTQVLRQFVFVPPGHFVVFDRVTSTDAAYKKTWLLHTARQPEVSGRIFSATHEQGRLFGQVILPADATITLVGGPGKQFMNGSRNWPLPQGYTILPDNELLGQWRIEVSPEGERKEDYFLHLLEVGDQDKLTAMGAAKAVTGQDEAGVEFARAGGTARVVFAIQGPPAGRIRICTSDKTLDQPLIQKIQPQAGMANTASTP